MIEHPDAVDRIESGLTEWQPEHVGLNHMEALPPTHVSIGRIHSVGEVHPDHLRSEVSRDFHVPSGAAAYIEHELLLQLRFSETRLLHKRLERLIMAGQRIYLSLTINVPLKGETLAVRVCPHESGNPPCDRIDLGAAPAPKRPPLNFLFLSGLNGEVQGPSAIRANEILNQRFLHFFSNPRRLNVPTIDTSARLHSG